MINRIIGLKGVGRFEQLKSANGNEGDFAKVNVVFARNACGKTTLCDVFRSLGEQNPTYIIGRSRIGNSVPPEIKFKFCNNKIAELHNGKWNDISGCPHIYVYDERFVRKNVFVGAQIGTEQKRNVYSLALGQKAIELNNRVNEAGKKLARATTNANQFETVLSALIPSGCTIQTFREISKIENVDFEIEKLSKRIENERNKKNKTDQIQRKDLLKKIIPPSLPQIEELNYILSTTLDNAALTAEEKIKKHLEQFTNRQISVQWIQQGYNAQTSLICPYCGQDMSHVNLLEIYKVFFSGELKIQETQRNNVRSKFLREFGDQAFNEIQKIIDQNQNNVDWWKDVCGLSIILPALNTNDIKNSYLCICEAVLSAIERKQNNLTISIPLKEEEQKAFNMIRTTISLINSYNNAIEGANATIQTFKQSVETINIDELVREMNNLCNAKKRYEENVVHAYEEYDNALLLKQEAQTEKTQVNEELKQESELIFNNFGQKINEILARFGVNFKIINNGINLRSGGVASGQLVIELMVNNLSAKVDCSSNASEDPSCMSLSNTLSGGDCSALALAFFLATLDTDNDLASAIVVIDDPYHDQDRSRQSQTISLLKKVANDCSQFFLFSHNLEFAQMFMSNKGIARNEIRAFEIPQLGDSVELKHGELPQLPSKSYETDYSELFNYVTNPGQYQDRLKEIVGRIRPLLETYLRYKYPLNWGQQEWLGDMISKIRSSKSNDIIHSFNSIISNLEDINNYTQRFHHSVAGISADVPDSIELKTYAQLALDIVHHA